MNILYCGDEGIKRGVLVSVLSLLKHNPGILHIYIMTVNCLGVKPFTEKSAQFLDSLVKKTNPKNFIKLIDATEVFMANLPERNMKSYFTPCSMLRLYIDKIPELNKLERILYLDYDVVCRGNLGEFYNTDLSGESLGETESGKNKQKAVGRGNVKMGGKFEADLEEKRRKKKSDEATGEIEAAGVLDIYGRHFYHYHGLLNDDYMNSGVMLFNVTECNRTGMFGRAVSLCKKRWMMLADQAALNKAISRRKLMPRKYNEQGERPRPDTVLHHFSNNFKFFPFFKVQKVKPFEVEKIHKILKIYEYDDILKEYERLKSKL